MTVRFIGFINRLEDLPYFYIFLSLLLRRRRKNVSCFSAAAIALHFPVHQRRKRKTGSERATRRTEGGRGRGGGGELRFLLADGRNRKEWSGGELFVCATLCYGETAAANAQNIAPPSSRSASSTFADAAEHGKRRGEAIRRLFRV